MGYNVIAYQANAKKIQAFRGSHDKRLLDALLAEFHEDIEYQIDYFGIDFKTYKKHATDIVEGKISHDNKPYLYGYIYELLCQKYGKDIESDEFMSFLGEAVDDNYLAFIPIPENEDWPEFYSIKFNDLDYARNLFLSNEEDYAQEDYYIEEINNIFDTALSNKKDLVFFGY